MSILTQSNSTHTNIRAFTLVEMIVSLAVFSIVAVVALGALVKIVSANRKAQTLQTSITNLNFALETMSRELRTGHWYFCESNMGGADYIGEELRVQECPGGGYLHNETSGRGTLAFRSSKSIPDGAGGSCAAAHAYWFKPNSDNETFTLEKAVQTDCDTAISDDDFYPIVDDDLTISGYYMRVDDDEPEYPMLTIRITGYAGVKERERTYFDVQTSAAPHVKR